MSIVKVIAEQLSAPVAFVVWLPMLLTAAEPLPPEVSEFLVDHCSECHSGEGAKASIRLDRSRTDWNDRESLLLWERVYDVLRDEIMPPADAVAPRKDEQARMIGWLRSRLIEHARVGGTTVRRLNREEYEHTIEDLFGFDEFRVPNSFPVDDSAGGFDNVGSGLFLSPPLMAQYLQLATEIADEILPPDRGPASVVPKLYQITPGDLTVARDAGAAPWEDRFRLVSSKNMADSAAWPTSFEARQSGVYRLSVDAAAFQTDKMFYPRRTTPLQLGVYSRMKTEQIYAPFNEVRKLAEFKIPAGTDAQTYSAEVKLEKGRIFGLRWCDGPCYSEVPSRGYAEEFFADRLRKNRRHYAAMLRIGGGARGMTQEEFYLETHALIQSDDLDLNDPRLDKLPEKYGGGLSNGPHRWIKSYVHEELFRFGPAVDITGITIEGPLRLIEDEAMKTRKARTQRFLSQGDPFTENALTGLEPARSVEQQAASVLRPFLERAFRREITDAQLREYVELSTSGQSTASWRLEDGLHLAIRRALVSPQFLYRSTRPGVLDDFDLASRLSYFLTSAPPDEQLTKVARRGELTDPKVLEREARRLLNGPRVTRFLNSFGGQWLWTRRLDDIMPDPRLLKFFDADRLALVAETEQFVAEMLRENHPLEMFIDPGFSYRSALTNKIYGDELEGSETRRVSFPKGGRHGGILGLGSVMMATANGVDTHPVHRGVWVLENVLGTPTPPPPADVPAIAPDTSGITSMRDQLDAHRADEKCAGCHNRIDPLGMVLENFDPVGRWRDHYPRYAKPNGRLTEEFYSSIGKGTFQGPKVDAKASMPDGGQLDDVTDLKRYVLDRIDMFSRCLTEKLLTYGTGRRLGFADRRVVDRIVADARQEGNGFRDLILAVVQSESFRTK